MTFEEYKNKNSHMSETEARFSYENFNNETEVCDVCSA